MILTVLAIVVLLLVSPAWAYPSAQAENSFKPVECWFDKPLPIFPGPAFECGYVNVPERHEVPDGPTIQIPVAISRTQASNAKPDPLFLAQGGPGGDAFEVFPILLATSNVWRDRDIVIFNQRGTRYAIPDLSCTESFNGAAELLALPDEAAEKRSLELLQACYDRLQSEGVDLSAFNSLQNAADVEAIRSALGYDEYNFYGVSYGTLLGLHLLRDHESDLRSVILDAVVPTNLNFIPRVAANRDRVFTEIIETCEQSPECRQEYPNLEERFFSLVEELNASPISVILKDPETREMVDTELDGDTLVDVLFQAFYLPDFYAYFPKLVANLEARDLTFIEGIWPLFAFDRTISEGMYYSVVCAEDAYYDPTEVALDGARPYFQGRADEELQLYDEACSIWSVDRLPSIVNDPVSSQTPVLLLSGYYDPITPPYFADAAAESLLNDRNLVDPTGSHGVAFGDPCVNNIVTQFLNSPEANLDASCLPEIDPKVFAPIDAISFPFLSEINQLSQALWWQIGLAAFFLMIVLSVFVILPLAWIYRIFSSKEPEAEDPNGRRLRRIAGLLAMLFGLSAVIFVSGAVYYTFEALVSGLASIFAVSSSAAPFFAIPFLLTLLATLMVIVAIIAWRHGYWVRWTRIYFTVVSLAAVAYVLVLAYGGMLTVLL